jgi:RNA polymerase sigma-70 factor (ECF subfamily)
VQRVVAEILAGNPDAFRAIVNEYRDELLRIAWHFVHDWEEAGDITQETFIRCFRNLSRYDSAQPFKPWLYRIHLNCCRSASRNWWRRITTLRSVVEADAVAPETPFDEEDGAIRKAIERLSKNQKAAFIMIEIEGRTSKEAAELLGIAESTLRVHLARSKENLRKDLKGIFHDEG